MGVLDEVKILEANEVFIAYSENGNDIKSILNTLRTLC